ncbi:MAG: polysaccharide deacetylase family protein [Dehalobacterium sp.]
MQIQQILVKSAKYNKIFHLMLLIGVFLLLNSFNNPGSKAEKDTTTPVVTVQSGVFIGKYNQQPVFTLGSKVFNPQDILSNDDALISMSYIWSEEVPEEVIQAAIDGQKKGLHFLIELTEDEIKNKDFLVILDKISQYDLDFWISLIPPQGLAQKEYDKFYHNLWSYLKKNDIGNISLVWYPNTLFSENQGEWDQIDAVGLNISGSWDMANLDRIYKIFADKKEIIINENIIDTNPYNIKRGLDFLEEFYYALAVRYPAVTLVFQSSDLSRHADIKYHKAVEDLKQKSWITNVALETVNKPMFEALSADAVLTDQVELLYRPLNDNYQDVAYIEYKFNTETIIQAQRPPFVIKVDTNELHNGTNSLVTVVYNKQMKIMNKHKIYFEVRNENIVPRSKRVDKSYSKDQKPAYTGSYIPVLMYHDFAPKVSKELSSITVSAELFEKQLKALLDQGYTPVSFYQLNQYLNREAGLPSKPVIITTDDGYLSNYTMAYPLLKKYQIPATFFITTAFMGKSTQYSHITWAQAKEMEQSGLIDIQSHTHRHLLLNLLPEEEVVYETDISFGLIEKNLGKRDVKVLSYPEFRNTADTRKWIEGQGVNLQVTGLAAKQSVTSRQNIQRIHVHNNMSPSELINTIKKLTN